MNLGMRNLKLRNRIAGHGTDNWSSPWAAAGPGPDCGLAWRRLVDNCTNLRRLGINTTEFLDLLFQWRRGLVPTFGKARGPSAATDGGCPRVLRSAQGGPPSTEVRVARTQTTPSTTPPTDDGSCATLVVEGCTDADYTEYDASANTDDGSCATLVVEGCTDANYTEYDASANTDDGSCATLLGCTDSDMAGMDGYNYGLTTIGDKSGLRKTFGQPSTRMAPPFEN